ncbi:hypothetical protein HYV82_03225 [Candidatus Woesearchaeota archaeon]|nr:hypothetical protein [Candidatus Woesearchaeota archaeon]
MPKKRFGAKQKERKRQNPVFWLIAFLFTVTAGLALLDFGRTFSSSGNGISGAMTGVEGALSNEELVKCGSASDCPSEAICVQGYCAVDVSGEATSSSSAAQASKPSNAITGAISKAQSLFTKTQLVKCQSNFDCLTGALCKEGYCFKPVPKITGMPSHASQDEAEEATESSTQVLPTPAPLPASCKGYCGGKSAGSCHCDSVCEKYGDCCPDYKAECGSQKPECVKDKDCVVVCVKEPCPEAKCVEGKCVIEDKSEKSCKGYCGNQAPSGCYCDNLCSQYGDCCEDYKDACGEEKPECDKDEDCGVVEIKCLKEPRPISKCIGGKCALVEYCGDGNADQNCYCNDAEEKSCVIGDPCKDINCPKNTDIKSVSPKSSCKCVEKEEQCTHEYSPVCGNDNITYSNKCLASKAGVKVAYDGKCVIDSKSEKSCKGYCGKKAPSGCYCDAYCQDKQDCCEDYKDACGVKRE